MKQKNVDFAEYVEQASQLLNLSIPPEYLSGTIENIATIAAIASLVTEFDLPENVEAAPTFEP